VYEYVENEGSDCKDEVKDVGVGRVDVGRSKRVFQRIREWVRRRRAC
jgi:hypothetical protein